MNGVVTIRSGVFVGTRDDSKVPYQWFSSERVTRFAPITLRTADAEFVTVTNGLLGTGDEVTFTVQGRGLAENRRVRALKTVEARMVGQVQEALDGYRDVAISRGELVEVEAQLLGDPLPVRDWGVLRVLSTVQNGVNNWRAQIVFTPVRAAWLAGTGVVFAAYRSDFE